MINRTPYRAFEGNIIGYIEEVTVTKIKTAYDLYLIKLGTYDPRINITRTFENKVVGRGDILASLIIQAEAEYQAQKKERVTNGKK